MPPVFIKCLIHHKEDRYPTEQWFCDFCTTRTQECLILRMFVLRTLRRIPWPQTIKQAMHV